VVQGEGGDKRINEAPLILGRMAGTGSSTAPLRHQTAADGARLSRELPPDHGEGLGERMENRRAVPTNGGHEE
jgi:hypothetical protein